MFVALPAIIDFQNEAHMFPYYLLYYLGSGLGIYLTYIYSPWVLPLSMFLMYMGIDQHTIWKKFRKAYKTLNSEIPSIVNEYDLTNEEEDNVVRLIDQATLRMYNGQDPLEATERLKKELKEFLEYKA